MGIYDKDVPANMRSTITPTRMGIGLATAGSSELANLGIKTAKKGIDARAAAFKPIKEAKDLLAADVEAMKQGKLGLTQSQIQQQISSAQQAAGAQANAAQAALSQAALGGQGFQQGAFTEAAQGIQEEAQKAGTAASAQAHEMSRGIAEREALRIRTALDAQRERARQAAVATGQKAMGVVGGITSALGQLVGLPPGVADAFKVVGAGLGGGAPTEGSAFDEAVAKAAAEQAAGGE